MEVDVAPEDIEAETAYVRAQGSANPAACCVGNDRRLPAGETRASSNIWNEVRARSEIRQGFSARAACRCPTMFPKARLSARASSGCRAPGSTFDLCVLPAPASKAAWRSIDLAPDVQFVLDHCGVPDIKAVPSIPGGEQSMSEIARRPNVIGKVSGVVAYADPENWTVETLRLCIEHTRSAYSAGTAWCGAATGRSARLAAGCADLAGGDASAGRRGQRGRADEAVFGQCEQGVGDLGFLQDAMNSAYEGGGGGGGGTRPNVKPLTWIWSPKSLQMFETSDGGIRSLGG